MSFLQRPGEVFADSRVELTADPSLFLSRITSIWTATGDLGHVGSAQFIGYLFPMGTFFALLDALGIPMWIVNRLWIGALFSVAAWGTVRLMDELYDERRGIPHLVAGALFALNPYVLIFSNRSTSVLLAYVALPWMLIAVHRGLAAPRQWRWPVILALVLACAGGGINAALLPWVIGPIALLAAYEVIIRVRTWGTSDASAGVRRSVRWPPTSGGSCRPRSRADTGGTSSPSSSSRRRSGRHRACPSR